MVLVSILTIIGALIIPRKALAATGSIAAPAERRLDGKGCEAVPKSKCGTDWFDSCLKCGAGAFDCEVCCPGCQQVSKGTYKYCECKAPGPPPGGDSWNNYSVAGLQVISVTGGKSPSNYEKAVIMLHGGGGQGTDWEYNYREGWFGNLTGLKYVFPTSALPGHVWYISYKNGCGLVGDCAYNLSSIRDSASRVRALIQHEMDLLGGNPSKVFLAGFSEGAQLTSYMQLANLDFALGGAVVMDGYPLPPLCDMPLDPPTAKKNATYTGQDMRFMIWHGDNDNIFPVNLTMDAYHAIFEALGIGSTLKVDHTEPGQYHTLIKPEFDRMVEFIRS